MKLKHRNALVSIHQIFSPAVALLIVALVACSLAANQNDRHNLQKKSSSLSGQTKLSIDQVALDDEKTDQNWKKTDSNQQARNGDAKFHLNQESSSSLSSQAQRSSKISEEKEEAQKMSSNHHKASRLRSRTMINDNSNNQRLKPIASSDMDSATEVAKAEVIDLAAGSINRKDGYYRSTGLLLPQNRMRLSRESEFLVEDNKEEQERGSRMRRSNQENDRSLNLVVAAVATGSDNDIDNNDNNNNNNQNDDRRQDTSELLVASSQTIETTTPTATAANYTDLKCRLDRDLYMDYEDYKLYTCATCYAKVPQKSFWRKLKIQKRIWLHDEVIGLDLLPNQTDLIRPTFKLESTYVRWERCCNEAADCCRRNSLNLRAIYSKELERLVDDADQRHVCPGTWDSLSCWPETAAGSTAQHDCPDFAYFTDYQPICPGIVYKQCLSNGSWFVRNEREWSDYSKCSGINLYAARMYICAAWYVVSTLTICPALFIMHKTPNRGGSKRVKILSNLLFWLLISNSMSAILRFGSISGLFKQDKDHDAPTHRPTQPLDQSIIKSSAAEVASPIQPPSTVILSNVDTSQIGGQQQLALVSNPLRNRHARNLDNRLEPPGDGLARYNCIGDRDKDGSCRRAQHERLPTESRGGSRRVNDEAIQSGRLNSIAPRATGISDSGKQSIYKQDPSNNLNDKVLIHEPNSSVLITKGKLKPTPSLDKQTNNVQVDDNNISSREVSGGFSDIGSRCKRNTSDQNHSQQLTWAVFVCWFISVGLRAARGMAYTWMFSGAVYLCSVLHYAPAEPPAMFIKSILVLSNLIPSTMTIVYMIARSNYEPSPLNLILKLPYYYIHNETDEIENLWATQLSCWMFPSTSEQIEWIIEKYNLLLLILNTGLFIVTLTIVCRINRPGCTRHEMSVIDYFKAAGTLVIIYGAHFMLFELNAYTTGCFPKQATYYAFHLIDGLQSMIVAYVFCYKTSDAKELLSKWWSNCLKRGPKWCRLPTSSKFDTLRKHEYISDHNNSSGTNNHHHHKSNNHYKSSNHSTRTNNSVCNARDVTTELIDVDDNLVASQF